MYSSLGNARNHLRSAMACLVVGCLILLMHTSLTYTIAYTMVAPAGPLWLSLHALNEGAYRDALWWAGLGAIGCGLVAAFWGIGSTPGLFCLAALLFSGMACTQLRHLR